MESILGKIVYVVFMLLWVIAFGLLLSLITWMQNVYRPSDWKERKKEEKRLAKQKRKVARDLKREKRKFYRYKRKTTK